MGEASGRDLWERVTRGHSGSHSPHSMDLPTQLPCSHRMTQVLRVSLDCSSCCPPEYDTHRKRISVPWAYRE